MTCGSIDGFLVTYKKDVNKSQANHELFGKINKVNTKKKTMFYYYPGLLNDVYFLKISDGCVFSTSNITNDKFVTMKAVLISDSGSFVTGKKEMLKKAEEKGLQVKNLNL